MTNINTHTQVDTHSLTRGHTDRYTIMLEVYFGQARSFGTLFSLSAALGCHEVYDGHEGLQAGHQETPSSKNTKSLLMRKSSCGNGVTRVSQWVTSVARRAGPQTPYPTTQTMPQSRLQNYIRLFLAPGPHTRVH